jgi:hypothetical protein
VKVFQAEINVDLGINLSGIKINLSLFFDSKNFKIVIFKMANFELKKSILLWRFCLLFHDLNNCLFVFDMLKLQLKFITLQVQKSLMWVLCKTKKVLP